MFFLQLCCLDNAYWLARNRGYTNACELSDWCKVSKWYPDKPIPIKKENLCSECKLVKLLHNEEPIWLNRDEGENSWKCSMLDEDQTSYAYDKRQECRLDGILQWCLKSQTNHIHLLSRHDDYNKTCPTKTTNMFKVCGNNDYITCKGTHPTKKR